MLKFVVRNRTDVLPFGLESNRDPSVTLPFYTIGHSTRSDDFIVHRIKEGKEGAMPAFEGALTNAQIKSIVRYIRNLKEN